MGILDEIRDSFGPDFFDPETERPTPHHWYELCVCGHLDRYHGPTVGGTYRLPEPTVSVHPVDHVEWTDQRALDGCVGALRPRGFAELASDRDEDTHTVTVRINPTCPCDDFRPVARVDRPNRFFNQRMPRAAVRGDRHRHPFMVGIRAFLTHLGKRKAAQTDPDWATAEFDRRFTWLDGARVCGISRCTETDDVWPVFVTDDRSELRCKTHR